MNSFLLSQTQKHLVDNHFSLVIKQKENQTKITMQLFDDKVNTSHISFIIELLKQHLPNVLLTACYNEDNLPFDVEVKNTELGHLFEHILLEYLCQLKIEKGADSATYAGRTRWNWVRDPMGKFHIRLDCGINDADILPQAVEKTIHLMKIIMENEHSTKQNPPQFLPLLRGS